MVVDTISEEDLLSALGALGEHADGLRERALELSDEDPPLAVYYQGQVAGIMGVMDDITVLAAKGDVELDDLVELFEAEDRKHDRLIRQSRKLQEADPATSIHVEGEAVGIMDAVRDVRYLLGLPPYGPL